MKSPTHEERRRIEAMIARIGARLAVERRWSSHRKNWLQRAAVSTDPPAVTDRNYKRIQSLD